MHSWHTLEYLIQDLKKRHVKDTNVSDYPPWNHCTTVPVGNVIFGLLIVCKQIELKFEFIERSNWETLNA